MNKTKAGFRALREEIGMSQQDIADEADVTVQAVKKWESELAPNNPPDDVWRFMLECRGAMHEDARELAEAMVASYHENNGVLLHLPYYRTQEQLDKVQLPAGLDEPVGYFNARMRLVARMLERAEVRYEFEYGDRI